LGAWDKRLKETGDPTDRDLLDSRRLLNAVRGHRNTEEVGQYELPSLRRRVCEWVRMAIYQKNVVRAYDSIMKAYPASAVNVEDSSSAGRNRMRSDLLRT